MTNRPGSCRKVTLHHDTFPSSLLAWCSIHCPSRVIAWRSFFVLNVRMTDRITEIDGKWYMDQATVAVLLDVSVPTLISWGKGEKPPPQDPKTRLYPMVELGVWIRSEMPFRKGRGNSYPYLPDISRYPNRGVLPGADEPPVKHIEEARLKKLQADKLQVELDEMARQLIPVNQVSEAFTQMTMRVKTRLLKLPTSLAPLVHGQKDVFVIQSKLEAGVKEALEQLADDWHDVVDDGDEDA